MAPCRSVVRAHDKRLVAPLSEILISPLNLQVVAEVVQMMGATLPDSHSLVLREGLASGVEGPWLPASVLDQVYSDVMDGLGRSDFGLQSACSPVLARLGMLPMLLLHSPDLRTAIEHIRTYGVLHQGRIEFTQHEQEGMVHLRFDVMCRSPRGRLCRNDFVVLSLTQLLRMFGQGQTGLVQVCFDHPEPPHADQYPLYFDAPISFGAPQTVLSFKASMLDKGLGATDPMIYQAVMTRMNLALSELRGRDRLLDQVNRVLAERLHLKPRITDVATALGLHERTLRRRLAELGVDHQQLLQRLQQDRASAALALGERSIQQVASTVGFASVAAFHRAFLRWTGHTPKAWREGAGRPS
jgi:AraC-like DNA-binding protein